MGGEGFDEILADAQTGSTLALGALYRDFNPRVCRYFAARVPALAEDLAHETWLSVASQLRSFSGNESAFWAWLFTIARRRLVDHWRKSVRSSKTAVADRSLTESRYASTDIDRLEAMDAIAELTYGMSADQVEVVLLRILGGLSVEEVAAIIGKQPGAVRVIQHRALRKAASRLAGRSLTP